jgi:hypothetical protein
LSNWSWSPCGFEAPVTIDRTCLATLSKYFLDQAVILSIVCFSQAKKPGFF